MKLLQIATLSLTLGVASNAIATEATTEHVEQQTTTTTVEQHTETQPAPTAEAHDAEHHG
jgi:hypothetical protein